MTFNLKIVSPPDYLHQLAHVNMVRNKKLGLVQDRKLLLPLIPLNDNLGGKIGTFFLDIKACDLMHRAMEYISSRSASNILTAKRFLFTLS